MFLRRHGLTDEAWEHFSDPRNFGKDFEGIKAFKNNRASFIRSTVNDGHFPNGYGNSRPKFLANSAVDPSAEAANKRKQLAVYLERFAYFFSRDFFISKSFEVLNSELKPEHTGFRKAAETLFQLFKEVCGLTEDSLVEYCYTDDYYTTLDLDKTDRFYAWLHVTKPIGVEPDLVESNMGTVKVTRLC